MRVQLCNKHLLTCERHVSKKKAKSGKIISMLIASLYFLCFALLMSNFFNFELTVIRKILSHTESEKQYFVNLGHLQGMHA